MSASTNDDPINSSPDSELIQDIDQSLMGPMLTAVSLKNNQPSQLIDFAGDDKSLQLIAQNLHQLLSSPNTVKFTAENKQNLELIMQTFITDTVQNSTKKYEDFSQCQSDIKKLQKELFETKNKLENYKYLLSNSEKSKSELSNENKELQTKIDSLYRNQASSINKMKKIKQEYENQIIEIKNENYQLKEKLREMQDDCKIREYATKRNLEQFTDLASQATKSNDKIEKLKEKLKKKNKQIKNLQSDFQKLKLANQMLEDDSQKMKASLATAHADLDQIKQKISGEQKSGKDLRSNSSSETSNYCQIQSALISISEQFERQSEELIQLRKSHMVCTTLLHKQVEIVAEYEKQIDSCEKALTKNSELSSELDSTKEELVQTIESLNSKIKFIKSLMNLCKVEKEEELPLYIMKVHDYGIMENRRLVSAFEDNLRFMTNIINSNLIYDDQNIPLNEDKQFISSLQFEVSKTRQFILENTVNREEPQSRPQSNFVSNNVTPNSNINSTINIGSNDVNINANSNNEDNSEKNNEASNEINEEEQIPNQTRADLAILTSQILRNEILRKSCEKLKHNSDAFLEVVDVLKCNDDPESASRVVLQNEATIKSFIDNILKLLKVNSVQNNENMNNDNFVEDENDNFTEENDAKTNFVEVDRKQVFDDIIDFIESNNALLNEIKNSLKFTGDNSEIPFVIEKLIHKNEMLSNPKNKNRRNSVNKNNKPAANPQENENNQITTRAIEIDDQNKDSDKQENSNGNNNDQKNTHKANNKKNVNNENKSNENKVKKPIKKNNNNNNNKAEKENKKKIKKTNDKREVNHDENENKKANGNNNTNKNNSKKESKKSNNNNNNDNDDLNMVDEDTDHIILEATQQLKKNADDAEPKFDWKKRIHSCVIALKKLNNENKSLKQQLIDAQQQIKDVEKRNTDRSKTLSMITDSYKGLEKFNNELLQKNRDLLSEMEKKSKLADARVFKVLDQERAQHLIEIENLQNKNNASTERFKARLEEKKKKIIALKKKLKEVINTYEDAFKQQKATIIYLRKQLDSSITNSNNNEIMKEVQQLTSQLKASESERQNLEMKIDQIKDENVKSQAIRDTFWKAQIAIVEQNMQQEVEKERKNVLETIASQFNCEPTLTSIINSYYFHDADNENKNKDDSGFPRNCDFKIETQAQKQLNEWEKWGRALFTNMKNGEVFMYNSNDLRFMLSEMIMSSVSQRYLLNRLESLRTQKRILLKMNSYSISISPSDINCLPNIRSLLILSIGVVRVKKIVNYLPLQQNQAQ